MICFASSKAKQSNPVHRYDLKVSAAMGSEQMHVKAVAIRMEGCSTSILFSIPNPRGQVPGRLCPP